MKKINADLLKSLSGKARSRDRKRINLNFHDGDYDPLQRMLNAMQPGTYLQPHKHENPDKREVFLALSYTKFGFTECYTTLNYIRSARFGRSA